MTSHNVMWVAGLVSEGSMLVKSFELRKIGFRKVVKRLDPPRGLRVGNTLWNYFPSGLKEIFKGLGRTPIATRAKRKNKSF